MILALGTERFVIEMVEKIEMIKSAIMLDDLLNLTED